MDIDGCKARLLNYNNANGKANAAQYHIKSFMENMSTMVYSDIPCPWNEKLSLHSPDKHVEILKIARVQLSIVAPREILPTTLNIVKHLHPSMSTEVIMKCLVRTLLPPIDHTEKMALYKSFHSLRSG